MKIKAIAVLIVVLSSSLTGCWKYEDGGSFSVRTKENRITQSWTFDKVFRNGLLITDGYGLGSVDYTNSSIGFDEEGRFSFDYSMVNDTTGIRGDGSWALVSNNDSIQLMFDMPYDSLDRTYKILRLKEDEFWFEEQLNEDVYFEYQLKSENK